MIYCVWYPSGGFGHFINAVISFFGDNFQRPQGDYSFLGDGRSHDTPLSLPKLDKKTLYRYSTINVDPGLDHSVLIDNGIEDETVDFLHFFPQAKLIKICYDDKTWPIVAQTHIIKAMQSDLDSEIALDIDLWPDAADWARREKYFLYLRDHDFRHRWRPDHLSVPFHLKYLLEYDSMIQEFDGLGITVRGSEKIWQQWFASNEKYLSPVLLAQDVIRSINNGQNRDLSHIKDLWTQAVIYYFIWLEFGKEIPHNDYADFFPDTDAMTRFLMS